MKICKSKKGTKTVWASKISYIWLGFSQNYFRYTRFSGGDPIGLGVLQVLFFGTFGSGNEIVI